MTYESDNVLRAIMTMAGGTTHGVAYEYLVRLCECDMEAVKKECENLIAMGFVRKNAKGDKVLLTEAGDKYICTYHRLPKPG